MKNQKKNKEKKKFKFKQNINDNCTKHIYISPFTVILDATKNQSHEKIQLGGQKSTLTCLIYQFC